MASGLVLSRESQEVLVAELSRPPDNSFTKEMCQELSSVLAAPPDGARVLRLRGQPGVFCRGRDRSRDGLEGARATVAALTSVNRGLLESRMVTVAEVDGEAAGFGVGLAALCDVTVASDRSRFWFPEVTHGLAPALVLSWLPQVVGRRQAFWLTATGAPLDASSARALGLVNRVCSPERLQEVASEMVGSLLRHPAAVQAEIKRDLRDFQDPSGTVAKMAADRLLLGALSQPPAEA
jgi:enoyl-CoA hydratase/carnithine racemase